LFFLATAGHASIASRLIEHGANIEAQSERTKDTALSLACSGGRQDVVEVLLKNGANREHRNVSDYTGTIKINYR
jgi:ankyrin repeat domain-containing protein 17